MDLKLVEIEWRDAWSNSNYYDPDEKNDAFHMKEIGYV